MTERRDLLVRYGEIGLKGGNRGAFEKALAHNLKLALRDFDHGPVERPRGRIVVRRVERPVLAQEAASRLPGVVSTSLAFSTAVDLGAFEEAAVALMDEALQEAPADGPVHFKVNTSRSFKGFPMKSMEISAHLGGVLIQRFPRLKARMKDPEILLSVEVRSAEALLATRHRPGPGGLPVGTMGRVTALLSGGIDSPVAAYLAMKRGVKVSFINFHSYPFIPPESLDKVKAVAAALTPFQGPSRLFVVPFSEIQVAVKKHCPEELRTVLYRRMMMRFAERAAREAGALALVTGESLGQVASQTLENMSCIGAASSLPVLRPLLGFDKSEIMRLAERIGTYPLSIQPHPDCCTVFQPRHPKIRASLEEVQDAEALLDMAGLVETAWGATERIPV